MLVSKSQGTCLWPVRYGMLAVPEYGGSLGFSVGICVYVVRCFMTGYSGSRGKAWGHGYPGSGACVWDPSLCCLLVANRWQEVGLMGGACLLGTRGAQGVGFAGHLAEATECKLSTTVPPCEGGVGGGHKAG